jgi:hypothetical protein
MAKKAKTASKALAKRNEPEVIEPEILEGQEAVDYINQDNGQEVEAIQTKLAGALDNLDKVMSAKEDKFKKADSDFWKPSQKGEKLRGIYLGTQNGKKYKVHFIGTRDSKGNPMAVRVNGTAIITREFARGTIGNGVELEYHGEGKTDAGNKLQMFDVRWLEV